jgi:aspartyl-tRNA(Asn)/glutamyl-tRNA(Gln) amidotransferase subunit C
MKITDKDVQYVAELANLELTPEESERMLRDMNSILGHIDKLNELDTTNVEPMTQVFQPTLSRSRKDGAPEHEVLREDELRPCLNRAEVMKIAPKTDGVFFKVPKVIEK